MNADYRTLEEIRNAELEKQYKAFESDEDRLNWLVDLAEIQSSASYLRSNQRDEYLDKLLQDFFNPINESGGPDHDRFESRMDLLHNAKITLRADAGVEAEGEMNNGYFAGSEEKSYYTALESGIKSRMFTLDFFLTRTQIKDVYKDNYIQRVDSQAPNMPQENGADPAKRDARFKSAVEAGFAKCEKELLENGPGVKRQYYQYRQEMEKKLAGRGADALFSKKEQDILDAYCGSIKDQEIDRALSDTVFDLGAETKGALAQFNTKRSWIFFGRESKEHADLRRAAEDFQSKLQTFQDAEKLSPSERLKAVKDLQAASAKMEKLAEDYEMKKGYVRTESGDARLRGAQSLKQLGKETKTRMAVAAKKLEVVAEYEAQKDKKIENKEAGGDGRKKTNVSEMAQKYDMNPKDKKGVQQKHKDKGAVKGNEKEGPEMGNEGD